MDFFGAVYGCSLLPKICYTSYNDETWQLYLTQRTSKNTINHVTRPLTSADISIFYRNSANFAISRNTDIDSI